METLWLAVFFGGWIITTACAVTLSYSIATNKQPATKLIGGLLYPWLVWIILCLATRIMGFNGYCGLGETYLCSFMDFIGEQLFGLLLSAIMPACISTILGSATFFLIKRRSHSRSL